MTTPPVRFTRTRRAMDPTDLLDVLARADGEALTTPQVATAVDISQRAAWVYLSTLAEDGLVEREPGFDLKMDTWTLTDAGREAVGIDADDT
jgi:DNA-binding IclR family transcriptional regulator